MASFQKTASGWRAQIKLKGVRDSRVFPTKREAQAWAVARELEIKNETAGVLPDKTVQDAIDRYIAEVAPKHRGDRWENIRLTALAKQGFPVNRLLRDIKSSDLAEFRDLRLKTVKGSSVLREIKLLNSLFEVARKEWKWIAVNPLVDVSKPGNSPHRERLFAWWEIKGMLRVLGYRPRGGPVKTLTQSLAVMMLLALRTGMRSGELCKLTWSQVSERSVYLPTTKNGAARYVPLSRKAARVLAKMRGWRSDSVFGLTEASRDALFRKYRNKAKLEGFTFHDTRHTAATWMAKKVDVLTLCKIFGWKNVKQALTYYNPTVEDIAQLLD